jgi:tryptophanyl-tRNA synthetase
VGEDQLPHLELTREIARRFNSLYKKEIFPAPAALLTQVPRLLGLDGRKMSKSYDNTINLSDSEEIMKRKISDMFTDPKRIKLTDKGHPHTCNVYAYHCTFIPAMKDEVYDWCVSAKLGCTDCKKELAAGLIEKLKPFHKKREELSKDKAKIKKILEAGKEKAQSIAAGTLKEARGVMRI